LRYSGTSRAVAIVAGVVGGSFASTIETAIHMPTELSGSATLDSIESRSLSGRKDVRLLVGLPVFTHDVREYKARASVRCRLCRASIDLMLAHGLRNASCDVMSCDVIRPFCCGFTRASACGCHGLV